MEDERVDAIHRLVTRLGNEVYARDRAKVREGFWALYLSWLFHELKGAPLEATRQERGRAVRDMDSIYGRPISCDDLVQIARMHWCDLFDVVLIMPTVVEDLIEVRALKGVAPITDPVSTPRRVSLSEPPRRNSDKPADERVRAIKRLVVRLGDAVYQRTEFGLEGYWAHYLMALEPVLQNEPSIHNRRKTVDNLDRAYGRKVEWDDLVQVAREQSCDLFEVALLMPVIVEDLVELRSGLSTED